VPLEEARRRCFFVDSKGLVCRSRLEGLQHHKRPFAHDAPPCKTLLEAVELARPTALVGVSTVPGAFTAEVLGRMAEISDRPVVFPLSNPTSCSECTFEEALARTGGRCVFASGSPFPPAQSGGRALRPAQANNAYVFPAVGHAAALCGASSIPQEAFLAAAEALSKLSPNEALAEGELFPPVERAPEVAMALMVAVAESLCASGHGAAPADAHAGWASRVRHAFYDPRVGAQARL